MVGVGCRNFYRGSARVDVLDDVWGDYTPGGGTKGLWERIASVLCILLSVTCALMLEPTGRVFDTQPRVRVRHDEWRDAQGSDSSASRRAHGPWDGVRRRGRVPAWTRGCSRGVRRVEEAKTEVKSVAYRGVSVDLQPNGYPRR